jgi:hypothetical protein
VTAEEGISPHLCYPVRVPMTKSISMATVRLQSVLSTLLLVVLLFSANASIGAKYQAKLTEDRSRLEAEWMPAPTSMRSRECLKRNHALTTFPGQRVAADISKQNRVKHSPVYGLPPHEFGAPAAIVRQHLITTEQLVSYLSFRLSRPGGRAPPVFA